MVAALVLCLLQCAPERPLAGLCVVSVHACVQSAGCGQVAIWWSFILLGTQEIGWGFKGGDKLGAPHAYGGIIHTLRQVTMWH